MAAPPAPKPGEIIYTRFRFSGERQSKQNRPCLILKTRENMPIISLFVIPITHNESNDPNIAVEIPAGTRQNLGLSRRRCWLILTEMNEVFWPSDKFLDLQVAPGTTHPWTRGSLPNALMLQIQDRLAALYRP